MPLQKPHSRNNELTSVKVSATFVPSASTNMRFLSVVMGRTRHAARHAALGTSHVSLARSLAPSTPHVCRRGSVRSTPPDLDADRVLDRPLGDENEVAAAARARQLPA